MANKKNKTTKVNYEKLCREYAEHNELEKLNQQTRQRVEQMEKEMWAKEARDAYLRVKHEQRFFTAIKLIFVVLISMACIATSLVLAYEGAFAWWIAICVSTVLTVFCAFKTGYFWYEFKK